MVQVLLQVSVIDCSEKSNSFADCCPVGGASEYVNCTSAGGKSPPSGLPVCRGWQSVMLEDGILVVEGFRSWVVHIFLISNTPLWPLLEPDGRLERPDPINRLVMSSPKSDYQNKQNALTFTILNTKLT